MPHSVLPEYLRYQKHFTSLESMLAVQNLPEDQQKAIKDAYNQQALKISDTLRQMVLKLNSSTIFYRVHLYLELPILYHLVSRNVYEKHSIYVPDFDESITLQTITGCQTACIMRKPLLIIAMAHFLVHFTALGKWFILCHEAQHHARFHSERQLNRQPFLWNLATDAVINYDLIHNGLKDYYISACRRENLPYYNIEDKPLHQYFVLSDVFPDFELNMVGVVPKSLLKKIKIWRKEREWLKFNENVFQSIKDENLIEEDIYHQLSQLKNLDSCKEQNEHMVDSDDVVKKAKSFQIDLSVLKKLGIPLTPSESSRAKLEADKINEDLISRSRMIQKESSSHIGDQHGLLDELIERDLSIKNKLNLVLMIERAMGAKQSHYGTFQTSNEKSNLYKMSHMPEFQKSMGLKEPIRHYKKKIMSTDFNILVIQDVSGSMSVDILQRFFSLVEHLVKTNHCNLHYIQADVTSMSENKIIINRFNIDEYNQKGFRIYGGGGTEMMKPLAKEIVSGFFDQPENQQQLHQRQDYDMAIILSDGYFPHFTKDEFLNATQLYLDEKGWSNYHLKIPPIIILNSEESCFRNTDSLKTWGNGLQEFLLPNQETSIQIN